MTICNGCEVTYIFLYQYLHSAQYNLIRFLLLRQNTVPAKAKTSSELYHKNFLFFTRWHEMTIFREFNNRAKVFLSFDNAVAFTHYKRCPARRHIADTQK